MTTRGQFLGGAAAATGIAFCGCAMLDAARAQHLRHCRRNDFIVVAGGDRFTLLSGTPAPGALGLTAIKKAWARRAA